MTWKAAAAAIVLTALAVPSTALGRDRLAVVILVEDDRAGADRTLSDNLTEVAIGELAEGPAAELVGARELRSLLEEASAEGGLVGCLTRPKCQAHLGDLAGASRAVTGSVHRQAASYALELALVETRSARRLSEVSRTVPLELAALIAAVREGVAALLPPGESRSITLLPPPAAPGREGSTAAGASLSAPSAAEPPPAMAHTTHLPSFVSIIGYSAAGLAVVAFSASAVLGAIADEPPSGATRAQRQIDLSRRVRDADLANAFLLTGTLLTSVAAGALIWHLRH